MDTPLHRNRRLVRPWLRRVAALAILSGGALGCGTFDDFTSKDDKQKGSAIAQKPLDKPPADAKGVVPVKSESGFFDWSDWEWEDLDLFGIFPKAAPKVQPADAMVLQGDKLTPVKPPEVQSAEARMALARERFRLQDYVKAEKLYHRVGENEKNPPKLVEEAKFYEAESLRLQGCLPKAGDTYSDLMNKFPRNPYRELALQHMYDIANQWLEDTRQEMRETEEKEQGKRWFVVPRFVSFEKEKPLLDREGRAIQLLESVRFGDINGPLADKSLFLCGSIKFFNEDYKEADHYFTQISEKHPDSKMVENAIRLAIISKHLSTGGSDYDGRKVAEARILVDKALRNYPDLNEKGFLVNQLKSITQQQAEKDFRMAEFYERTGHSGSAVFYFELVARRYQGTEFATDAAKRRDDILAKMSKEQAEAPANAMPGKAPVNIARPQLEQAPAPRVLPPDLGTPR